MDGGRKDSFFGVKMGVGEPKKTTPLFVEMSIATELLHITHSEYRRLPKVDRVKLEFYTVVKNEKHELEMEKIREKYKNKEE